MGIARCQHCCAPSARCAQARDGAEHGTESEEAGLREETGFKHGCGGRIPPQAS